MFYDNGNNKEKKWILNSIEKSYIFFQIQNPIISFDRN